MHYSRTARYYHWLESLFIGSALRLARLAHLDAVSARRPVSHALLVGEGNGSFLVPFAARYPEARITVVDESPEMLQVARSRLAAAGLASERIEFLQGDLRSLSLPERSFDLIVTLFFFDNFGNADVREMIAALACAGTVDAQWLLADFCIAEKGWRAWRSRLWLKLLYGFFGLFAKVPVKALPDTEASLPASGFERIDRQSFCGAMLYSSLYQRCGTSSVAGSLGA